MFNYRVRYAPHIFRIFSLHTILYLASCRAVKPLQEGHAMVLVPLPVDDESSPYLVQGVYNYLEPGRGYLVPGSEGSVEALPTCTQLPRTSLCTLNIQNGNVSTIVARIVSELFYVKLFKLSMVQHHILLVIDFIMCGLQPLGASGGSSQSRLM